MLRQVRTAWIVQLGKMVGTGGSAVSSMLGQLLTSAEIEEVRGRHGEYP